MILFSYKMIGRAMYIEISGLPEWIENGWC